MKIIQQTNKTLQQTMGYTFVADSGEVLVVDGGASGNGEELKRVIKKVGGHVDLWLITHPHCDHHNAIIEALSNPEGITYDKLGASQLPDSWAEQFTINDKEELFTWNKFAKTLDDRYFDIQKGSVFQLGTMKVEVLAVANPELTVNPFNNQSCVFRITEGDFTMLILGDLGVEAGEKLLSESVSLKADGVQMAHHGQQGVNEKFYLAVMPTYCFWSTPDWLWCNKHYKMLDGPEDTGNFKTKETRAWMEKLNTVNITNFDETVVFDTHTKQVEVF